MKDAKSYEKKVKKLLVGMKKGKTGSRQDDPLLLLVRAALEENASTANVEKSLSTFEKEFVDINELRVAQPGELVDLLDRSYPNSRRTSERITTALNKVFYDANDLTLGHLESMAKRDLRRKLSELGLSPYIAGTLILMVFNGHAIPVDEDLVETLEMDGYVAPGSDLTEVQAFLERVISQKDAIAAHEFFRGYVAKRSEALAKKRKAEQQARLAAERKAAQEAEAKARAEAEKKAAAEARAKAKAAKVLEKKRATRKAEARKFAARKTGKAARKKTVKAAAHASRKKTVGKTKAKKAKKAEKTKK